MSRSDAIARTALKKGIYIDDVLTHWYSSWHETDDWAFATVSYKCDACGERILAGELYSQGTRKVVMDAHWMFMALTESISNAQDGRTPEEIIKETPSLQREPCFKGLVAIITGEMTGSKMTLRTEIETNGGVVKDSITKQTTHMIVGRPGRTEHGQITGPGSKKYKEGKKKRLIEVDEAWVSARLERWRKTGIPALQEEDEEDEEESQSEEAEEGESDVQQEEEGAKEIKNDLEKEQDVRKEEEKEEEAMQQENVSQAEEEKKEKKESKKRKRDEDDDEYEDEEQKGVQAKKQKTVVVAKEKSEVDFDIMKRKQLQALAKKHGIPANLKNEELKERLRKVSQN